MINYKLIRTFLFLLSNLICILFVQCSSKSNSKNNELDEEIIKTIRLHLYKEKSPYFNNNISIHKISKSFANAYNDSIIIDKVSQIITKEEYQENFKRFLTSQDIPTDNLSFSFMSNEEFNNLRNMSMSKGYNIDSISEIQSEIQELYDYIRIRNLELKRLPIGWEIDIEFMNNEKNEDSGNKKNRFIAIVSDDKKSVIRIDPKSEVYFKKQHEIISRAIRENY